LKVTKLEILGMGFGVPHNVSWPIIWEHFEHLKYDDFTKRLLLNVKKSIFIIVIEI